MEELHHIYIYTQTLLAIVLPSSLLHLNMELKKLRAALVSCSHLVSKLRHHVLFFQWIVNQTSEGVEALVDKQGHFPKQTRGEQITVDIP